MMHARSLVRRLLRRLGGSGSLINQPLNVGKNLNRYAQSCNDLNVRDFVAVLHQGSQRYGEDRAHVSQLSDDLAKDGLNVSRVPDFKVEVTELNSWARDGIFLRHVVPLDELNRHFAGQLSGKSSRGRE